jgi:hypothetical protein
MKVLEMSDNEIEVYLKNRELEIQQANINWVREKEYLIKRSMLRKEYEESVENGNAYSFDCFCRAKGLDVPEDMGEELTKDEES